MVLLLISASWILVLTLIAGLCNAAHNGDLQHHLPTSRPVLGGPTNRESLITITHFKQGQRTTHDYAQADLTETAA
jgi:hypothetical protein